MSAISEVNFFMSRKAWIPTKRSLVKSKYKKPVPKKWVFKSKEEAEKLIPPKSRNVVKGYMQVPGFDFTESLLPVVSDTSTSILIGLTLYHWKYGWIAELCDVDAEFLHPNTEVEMYIKWPEVIMDFGIITKKSMEEYCILLEILNVWEC